MPTAAASSFTSPLTRPTTSALPTIRNAARKRPREQKGSVGQPAGRFCGAGGQPAARAGAHCHLLGRVSVEARRYRGSAAARGERRGVRPGLRSRVSQARHPPDDLHVHAGRLGSLLSRLFRDAELPPAASDSVAGGPVAGWSSKNLLRPRAHRSGYHRRGGGRLGRYGPAPGNVLARVRRYHCRGVAAGPPFHPGIGGGLLPAVLWRRRNQNGSHIPAYEPSGALLAG